MGAINWIFVISARFVPILVATDEVAQLSLVIVCCLLGFFFLRPVVANRRRSKVQRWNLQAHQVNDSLYELHKPKGDPTIQVLFFHGLPFGECSEAYLSTWISEDESCIWPKEWLAEEFPDAHILVVSYIEGLRKGSAENFDMHIISENLTSDLMQANIGQTPHCPVVLVGHSFGGLVIKELCRHANETFKSSMNAAKVKNFLDSLRGIFYYSTPHHGSSDIGRARSVLSRPLFDYFTTLSKDTGRLNSYFQNLCTCYPKWKIEGLGETLPVKMGIFRGIVVVTEASARDGLSKFNLDSADHFTVCRPEKKSSRRFNALTTLLSSVCDKSKEEKAAAERKAIRQNLELLPKQLVNMDVLVQEVKSGLQKFTTLGLVGMGGLGKTTLERAVFNELSPAYEYSCFLSNIKFIKRDDLHAVKKTVWKHMHCLGKKVLLKNPLDFTTLSTDTSRLNSYLQNLCACYPKWKIEGLGEMFPVKTGMFRGIVVVPEASARDGVSFNLDTSAEHFSVCRPQKKTLTTLLTSVCDSSKEEKAMAEKQAIRQNWEFVPKQLVNMDVVVHEVKGRLQKFNTLGLVGMGGLGKTALARAVFNERSPAYEYSCFVRHLKGKGGVLRR